MLCGPYVSYKAGNCDTGLQTRLFCMEAIVYFILTTTVISKPIAQLWFAFGILSNYNEDKILELCGKDHNTKQLE